jgi:hypothetical protein
MLQTVSSWTLRLLGEAGEVIKRAGDEPLLAWVLSLSSTLAISGVSL